MRTAIDASGRLVVPKRIRESLGLSGGDALEIDVRDGVIEIRPAPIEVDIVETPDGPVARARSAIEPLKDQTVRDTLESVRR